MRTIITITMWSLGLGLLSSLGACAPPVGPDQQEAGFEKSDTNQPGGSDKAGKLGNARTESPEPATIHSTQKHATIDAFMRCFDSCADKPADDRPACHDNCVTNVSAGSGDPTAGACPRSCTKALGSCLAPCGKDELVACRDQCRAVSETCIDGCN
jgi:hypothetical protein